MTRHDCLYAFVVSHKPRPRIHRISIRSRHIKALLCVFSVLFCAAFYGLYSLSQQAVQLRLKRDNNRLRMENVNQRQLLNSLQTRIEAIEDASRRLADISGVLEQGSEEVRGAGGPALPVNQASAALTAIIERRTSLLERRLRMYEILLLERAKVPSIWPVQGEATDGFGTRRNPFDGALFEFHAGQDIAAPRGAPVMAAGSGTVAFAGVQSGYGQIVIVDHGGNVMTRYGHLLQINVAVGQTVERGEMLGRVGSTGRSTGPHLHYEVRINDQPVNPKQYLPREG
ncbi:MAG: M23 family metallopeptidase [Pyrinomonadaceae bacterium]|nr:M23 family metallopeptidase [Pyrinomonadaceae bacterium]